MEAKSVRQFLRFGINGVAGAGADMGALYLALALGSGPYLGRLLSFLFAVWVTWRLNRRFTFRATESVWREWWRYLTVMLGGGVINLGTYMVLLQFLPEALWAPAVGVGVGSLAGMTFNFISAKYFVFRELND
jgi:putative flippase GtrA